MAKLLPILSVSAVGAILFAIFMSAFKRNQSDLRTKLYVLVLVLFGAGAGLWLHFGSAEEPLKSPIIYMVLQGLFLLLGMAHVWYMYKWLFWSKRDPRIASEDSFWPELVYTLGILFFMTAAIIAVYGYYNGFDKVGNFYLIGILFILPFIYLKSYDVINQIPVRDFSQKWQFSNERIKEDQWDWVNEIWVQFRVRENWEGERKKSGRKAVFRIHAPRKVPIREVFRLAVREYNRGGPEISVQDLGFEQENADRFWWLFSIKFVWYRPNTWFRKVRYLDPYSSTVLNEVRPTDIILAKRISMGEEVDEEYIPTGEF